MATTVGEVAIDIRAKMDKLQADVSSGKSIMQRGMNDMQAAATAMQGYLSMLGVNAFAGYIKSAIDAAGALADLSQKTGISAETLSGLGYAAKMSGTTLDGVALGLKKLAMNMYDTSKGTGEAQAAFKTLGISVTDANGKLRTTDSVMLDVADRFKEMDDGPKKAALAMKIFGKSGEELIPLLNEGGAGIEAMRQRAEELGLTVSDETASAMEALGDKFDTVGMASQGTARQIAASLTPAMTVLADMFLEGTKKGSFFTGVVEALTYAFKSLATIGIGVASVFALVGNAIGGIAAAGVAWKQEGGAAALRVLGDMKAKGEELSDYYNTKLAKMWEAPTQGVVKHTKATNDNTEATKKQIAEAEKQAKKIAEVTGKLTDELAMLKLTSVQADIYKQLKAAGVTANSAAGKEIANLVTKLDEEKALLKLTKDAQEESTKATKEHEAALIKETGSLLDKLNKAEQEYEQFGLSKSAIEELTLARLREKKAMYESWIQQGINVETSKKELAAIQEQIDLQAALIEVLGKTEVREAQKKSAEDALKAWQDTAKQIEQALTDALMRGFESGKDMVASIRDYIVNAFKSMVVKLAVQPVMGAITGAMGLFTGDSAMAASGAAQQASGVSNIMSTISTISTMASAFGSSIAAGFSSTIASFGATTGLAIEGGMASIAAGTSTAIASGLGQIVGALGPYALAATAVYALLGGFGGTYVKGQNVSASYDTEGTLTSRSVRQWDNVSDGGPKFDEFLGGIANTYQQMAKALGVTRGALGLSFETNDSDGGKYGFSASVNGKNVLAVPETKITDGAIELTASRAVFAALQASEMPRYLAGIFDGMAASAMTQEQLNAAIQTASAYQALHTTLTSLPLANLRDLSYQAASGLVAAAGGMDTLIKGLQSYYDLYYTAAEKNTVSATSISSALAAVGLDGSNLTTREDFRALFESVDASTSVGQQQVAALLQVAPTFATLSDYLVEQEKSLGDLATITPQLTLLTEATDAATVASVAAADATTSAIQTTTAAVSNGTSAVVAAVNNVATSVSAAVSSAVASAAASSAAATASAVAASNAAVTTLAARLDAIDSSNSLAAAAP